MTTQLTDFGATLIGMALLVLVWFRLWRPYTLDRLRYELFVIRDDLFDRAHNGEHDLSFTSDFYIKTREELNMLIRYCRSTSITQTLISHCLRKVCHAAECEEALPVLSKQEQEILAMIKRKQSTAMIRYLLQSSPLVWGFLTIVLLGSLTVLVPALIKKEIKTITLVFRKALANKISGLEYEAGQRILVDTAFFGRFCRW